MAYTKQTWIDDPNHTTPISAPRLAHIEQGIEDGDVTNPNSPATAALSATISTATKAIAAKPPLVTGAALATGYTGPTSLEYHDGALWGYQSGRLVTSVDDGITWTSIGSAVPGATDGILWCADGELLINCVGQVYKSSGWATNPATATWVSKVTKSAPAGVGILRWGFDGDGTKFIITEYSGPDRSESRYVWISTDMGSTFNVVLDKLTIDPTNTSHMHSVCYDPWEDRFWLSHGHGVIRGTYYSGNNGTTWTKLGGAFQPDAAPTVFVATDDGIVCASDSVDGGTYGIPRAPAGQLEMRKVFRWQTPQQAGEAGFANRGYRDPTTGLVYVGFKSDFANVPSIVAAATARAGGLVWSDPTPSVSTVTTPVVTSTGKLLCTILRTGSTYDLLTAHVLAPGNAGYDDGNMLGSITGPTSSVAVGPQASALTVNTVAVGAMATIVGTGGNAVVTGTGASASSRGVAIGAFAASGSATSTDSVAIGYASKADGSNIVVIGSAATTYAGATGGVAIGQGAIAGAAGVAFGQAAKGGYDVTRLRATAIGAAASAGTDSVSIGHAASTGTSQTAIGKGATATVGANGVALGNGTTTTAADQLAIGARHMLMLNVPAVPATPTGGGAPYVEGGALKYKGSSGTITVIAPA